MNVSEFRQQITATLTRQLPQAKIRFEDKRGIEVHCRAEIDATTFVEIYFSTATDKKNYALIKNGSRIFGYDNFRAWHRHPKENPDEHVACPEPDPDLVFREIREIVNLESSS